MFLLPVHFAARKYFEVEKELIATGSKLDNEVKTSTTRLSDLQTLRKFITPRHVQGSKKAISLYIHTMSYDIDTMS